MRDLVTEVLFVDMWTDVDFAERTEPETDRAMGVAGGCGCVLRVVGGNVKTLPVEVGAERGPWRCGWRQQGAWKSESRLAELEGVALGVLSGREEAMETEL